MIGLTDIGQSLLQLGARFAAPAANNSAAVAATAAAAEAPAIADTDASDYVNISSAGKQRLQRAVEREQDIAATRPLVGVNAELAASLAHAMAYRHDINVDDASSSAYASAAGGGVFGVRSSSSADQSRAQRIALYEMERAKGTSPQKIYEALVAFDAAHS